MESSVIFDGTLIHQSVVVTMDGGYQFHRLFTEANADLLWSIGMIVCDRWWGEWFDSGGEDHQHQQR